MMNKEKKKKQHDKLPHVNLIVVINIHYTYTWIVKDKPKKKKKNVFRWVYNFEIIVQLPLENYSVYIYTSFRLVFTLNWDYDWLTGLAGTS